MPELKSILICGIGGVLLLTLIGFSSVRNGTRPVNGVVVEIVDQQGDFFTDQLEVLSLMNADGTDYVLGLNMSRMDLKMLEQRVESHPFIKDAQIYRDIRGNVKVKVKQAEPIARIFRPSAPDQYIDADGKLLPTSRKHTARVPVIELERSFSWKEKITETEYGEQVLEVLQYIRADDFWRAQIAHLVIHKSGEITLLPQVSKQEVRFGMPEEIDAKFQKLKVFYTDILPNKGWNTYTSVNLKFKNQIVCE